MASGIHRNTTTRIVRKIEAPRPLKDSSLNELNQSPSYSPLALSSYAIDCVEKLIALMDMVVNSINQFGDLNANIESSLLTSNIIHLCKHLKIYGPQLENSVYQGQLDRAFLSFREGMVRGLLQYEARVHLLDIVELRECNWIPRKNLSPDFGEYSDLPSLCQPDDSSVEFGSDEVIKRPVKREKSSKPGSKSYCRNEVIIRNSDSGKVMGIKGRRVHMIEQLSETIISFQRVPPTAKERTVQITGPNEEKISYATRLIENTIRNNASPVKEFCESESSCSSEDSPFDTSGYDDFGNYNEIGQKSKSIDQPYLYKHKVIVRNCQLTITGDDYTYVTVAKAILDDYFSNLRKSESPDDMYYGEDILLNERLLQNENLKKSVAYNPKEVSEKGDPKSYTADFSEISNLTTPDEDTLSYVNSSLRNFSFNHHTETALSSNVSSLSSIAYGDARSDLTFSTKPCESVTVEPATHRTSYTKEFLLLCKMSKLSQQKPKNWQIITLKFPQLMKETERSSEVDVEEN